MKHSRFRVAIVGRPNVGKSTLFNRLTRTRRALVDRRPGMTRDRICGLAKWGGRSFEVMDTGGITPGDREHIPEQVLRQVEVAIREADLILLVVDVREGLQPLDQSLCSMLRARGREPLLVVNKVETLRMETEAFQFHALGLKRLLPISAEHNLDLDPLIGEILRRIPDNAPGTSDAEEIRVAIVGRPNVGKSSLLNRIVGEERSIVTSIPGTTRDAVDTLVRVGDQAYRFVDTAGIRRKSKTVEIAEKLSVVMARKNLERADVALLVLDASEPPSTLDAIIGRYAPGRGCLDSDYGQQVRPDAVRFGNPGRHDRSLSGPDPGLGFRSPGLRVGQDGTRRLQDLHPGGPSLRGPDDPGRNLRVERLPGTARGCGSDSGGKRQEVALEVRLSSGVGSSHLRLFHAGIGKNGSSHPAASGPATSGEIPFSRHADPDPATFRQEERGAFLTPEKGRA